MIVTLITKLEFLWLRNKSLNLFQLRAIFFTNSIFLVPSLSKDGQHITEKHNFSDDCTSSWFLNLKERSWEWLECQQASAVCKDPWHQQTCAQDEVGNRAGGRCSGDREVCCYILSTEWSWVGQKESSCELSFHVKVHRQRAVKPVSYNHKINRGPGY